MNKKWMLRFMDLTRGVAKWSKDPNKKIGALIVGDQKQIISQGYNGFPRGVEDYKERYNDREVKNKFVVHAEMNAVLNALYNGSSIKNATIFISGLPVCNECAKAIIQSGIKRVVVDSRPDPKSKWFESAQIALKMFEEAKVDVEFL